MAIRYATMSVADLDHREAVLSDLVRGHMPGIGPVSLTAAGQAKAHQELAQVRRMRMTAAVGNIAIRAAEDHGECHALPARQE